MLLNQGDKILVIHRRIFESDKSRFFIGEVEAYEAGNAKIKGHTYARDPYTTVVFRKNEERIKIISLSSGTLFVYLLNSTIDLSKLRFDTDSSGSFQLKEGERKIMDLNEIPHEEINPTPS